MIRALLLPHASCAAPSLGPGAVSLARSLCTLRAVPLCLQPWAAGAATLRARAPNTRERRFESTVAAAAKGQQTRRASGVNPDGQGTANAGGHGERKTRKCPVALHVAYVGTAYRGLQWNKPDAPGESVEEYIQDAIYAAGGILPTNYDKQERLHWSRSSRTDKGVHSLNTIVSLRMELEDDPEEYFIADPEGKKYVDAINVHLPDDIRVLSLQRVNKKFDARRLCNTRTYHYYLPARVVGWTGDPAQAAEDEARMEAVRNCLDLYGGLRPYHNYTKRARYRPSTIAKIKGRKPLRDRRGNLLGAEQGADDQKPAEPATDRADNGEPVWAQRKDLYRDTGMLLELSFQDSRDTGDAIGRSHYRYMHYVYAEDPAPLSPGGSPAIKISLKGEGFMLHQIRHMVAGAVLVARGILSLDVISASLCAPARITLPKALPDTLVLAAATFSRFPHLPGETESVLARFSGPELSLRTEGAAAQAEFLDQTLHAELQRQVEIPNWDDWAESLESFRYKGPRLEEFLTAHADFLEERKEVLEQRNAPGTEWLSERELFAKRRQQAREDAQALAAAKR